MLRRTLVITSLVVLALACAATPALAYEATASYVVDRHARLVAGSSQAVYMWSEAGGADLKAARVSPSTGEAGPYAVVTGIVAPGAWYAAGDGLNVTVVWKDGASVYVKRMDLSTPAGTGAYAPKVLCTDADAVALRGVGATVTPQGVVADGAGGAYVWCTVSPTSTAQSVGDTLLNHVSATGALAQPAPGPLTQGGTVAGMAAVGGGDALALLASPGRSHVAARRYAADLSVEWTRSPYLFAPPSAASSEPIGVLGGADAAIAWREGGKVKVQRFTEAGNPKFLSPPAVTMVAVEADDIEVADDGSGGLYLVAPSGTGLVARHILVTGLQSVLEPQHVRRRRDDAAGVRPREQRGPATSSSCPATATPAPHAACPCSPAWAPGPMSARRRLPSCTRALRRTERAAHGRWGTASNARLWHISNVADQLTFRPRANLVKYGKSVTVSGYMTAAGGLPVGAGTVEIGTVSSDQLKRRTTAQTGADGFYSKTVKPTANAVWSARGNTAAPRRPPSRCLPG